MPTTLMRIALLTIAFSVADGMETVSATAQADTDQLLRSKGIRKLKGKYLLAAEEDVFRSYQQTVAAMEEADQAIALAGDAASRNQSIIAFQQRVAFDRALRDQMRLEMRDGKSLDEQNMRRGAIRDLNIAKQQRALAGQAKARPKPREAKKLAVQAEESVRRAQESRSALAAQVGEIAQRYQTLAADAEVQKALAGARLAPSDRFKTLATNLGIKPDQNRKPTSLGETSRPVTDAIAELEQARDQLRNIPFRRGTKGFAERNQRRNDTVKAIEAAIAKLKRGEVDPKLVDEASELNRGYPGSSAPNVRDGLNEVRKRLEKAAALLRGS